MPDKEELMDFATWVANCVFDEAWEYNSNAFAEIACRKLCKLGIISEVDGNWVYLKEEEAQA